MESVKIEVNAFGGRERSFQDFSKSEQLSMSELLDFNRSKWGDNYLMRSVVVVNGKSLITCQVPNCDYQSDKNSNFKRHFETMHFNLNPPIDCCDMSFPTKGDFRHHSKSVHHEGHRCRLCGKLFNRKALLERHMAIHTGSKPFQCSKCEYASANKANVTRHLSIHSPGEAWILFDSDRINPSTQSYADDTFQPKTVVDVDSSTEIIDAFQFGRRGSPFSSTITSSPCSTVTIDVDEKQSSCSALEDSVSPASGTTSNTPTRAWISHSIESILADVITKTEEYAEGNGPSEYGPASDEGGMFPEEIVRKSKAEVVGERQGDLTRINEETRANWSHLSPYPMMIQNPSAASSGGSSSSPAAVQQQFPSTSYMKMLKHYQYISTIGYPSYDYSYHHHHDRSVVSHHGNQGTPGPINNNLRSVNQDSRLVPGFLPGSYHHNSNRNEVGRGFVSKPDVIHLVDPHRSSIARKGASSSTAPGSSYDCQEKVRKNSNNWGNNNPDRKNKRVHEELVMNERPPVPPQEFVNGNGMEVMIAHAEVVVEPVEDNSVYYVPKKLRLSKKFENSSA